VYFNELFSLWHVHGTGLEKVARGHATVDRDHHHTTDFADIKDCGLLQLTVWYADCVKTFEKYCWIIWQTYHERFWRRKILLVLLLWIYDIHVFSLKCNNVPYALSTIDDCMYWCLNTSLFWLYVNMSLIIVDTACILAYYLSTMSGYQMCDVFFFPIFSSRCCA